MGLKRGGWRGAVLALAVLAVAVANPAQAHLHRHRLVWHHHRIVPTAPLAPVDSGFGPTAAGASMIMVDAAGGGVLDAVGADIPRYPASLTKLMTLDLAFQALRDGRMTLDTQIPVSEHAAAVEPVKLGLPAGSTISVRDAILAMTTMSANDAATALGEYLGGGSEDRCGQMMTLRAHALGMAQTQFYNASGLPNPGQVTTARDLSILARDLVIGFPQYQSFFEVQNYPFGDRTIYSNNAMLKIYPGATGMKTGYTILARHNLVTSAVRGGRTLIGVVLHEPSWGQTYQQMTALLDAGFGGHVDSNMALAANRPPVSGPAYTASATLVATAARTPAPEPIQLAARPRAAGFGAGWTDQLGVYTRLARARLAALSVRRLRGVGIPRIARVESHGKTMWTAQLSGLSSTAARRTCSALAARRAACFVIAPQADHLAVINSQSSAAGDQS